MRTLDIVIQGLCLWLTGSDASVTAVVPDFSRATPAHSAVLTVPKTTISEGGCPPPFIDQGTDCTFSLNGAGAAGGVRIEVIGDTEERLDPSGLRWIPRIQHVMPLRMRREYAPDDGSRLAAQLRVARGTITAEAEGCGSDPNCPRSTRWTVTGGTDDYRLVLSNLFGGRRLEVKLKSGGVVTIHNEGDKGQATPMAHWCLYFTMFEEVACPGIPDIPPLPPHRLRTASRAVPPHAHGVPNIETIACSNSNYP
ncbi:MAG TPA: hypothetical protein VGF28_07670 [Thermoanaerobaculia bacterium]|jgi:hypothetical protein